MHTNISQSVTFQALSRVSCNYSVRIPTSESEQGWPRPRGCPVDRETWGHFTTARDCKLWSALYFPMSHHTHLPHNANLEKWNRVHVGYMLAHWILKYEAIHSLYTYWNTLCMPGAQWKTGTKLPATVILLVIGECFGFCIIKKIGYPSCM